MTKLSQSVGDGASNSESDVRAVQTLLNGHISLLIPLRPLTVDGKCGPRTVEAIRLFQARVVGLHQPDGKIDPGGPTWRKLTTLPPGALLALPESIHYYSYMSADTQFGSVRALESIEAAAKEFFASERIKIGIGHISHQAGGPMAGHVSHQKGTDVDIRPLRADGKSERCSIKDSHYSSERTKKLVQILRRDPNLQLILFNDGNILGVQKASGHDDHLHVRFKE